MRDVPLINCYGMGAGEITAALEAACSDRTRLLVVNSPCTPTGQLLDGETLDAVADFAVQRDLIVFSDEVYASILFGDKRHDSALTRPGMRERCVLVDSLSKRFSMTGWRLGFAAAPENLIGRMTELQEHTSTCAAPFVQRAAVQALELTGDSAKEISRVFERYSGFMANRKNQIEGLHCRNAEVTIYLFVDIRETGLNSEAYACGLLEKEQVAVVPGNAFGPMGKDAFALPAAWAWRSWKLPATVSYDLSGRFKRIVYNHSGFYSQ